MKDIAKVVLTEAKARSLTDEVKADAQALWEKCLQLYEGEAHLALGYSSWGAYWKAEFGESGRRGYQLLEAARTVKSLNNCSPPNECQARELARVPEEQRAEVWERVQESSEKVTARAIRKAVKKEVPSASRVLTDYTDPEAGQHGRTQLVELFSRGRKVRQLLEDGGSIDPRSKEDRESLLGDADKLISFMREIKRRLK